MPVPALLKNFSLRDSLSCSTPGNMGPVTPVLDSLLLLVVVWLFFIVAALAYLSRVLIKLRMSGWSLSARTADDWLLDAALVCELPQPGFCWISFTI